LTTSISSSRSLGEATAVGWLDADPFQFVNTLVSTAAAYVVLIALTTPGVASAQAEVSPDGRNCGSLPAR
jgi:hypothetical protein